MFDFTLNTLVKHEGRTRKVLTAITVKVGGLTVATRIVPGKWDAGTTLRELRLFPERFKLVDGIAAGGFTHTNLKTLALAA
jgi:hypothetical protein